MSKGLWDLAFTHLIFPVFFFSASLENFTILILLLLFRFCLFPQSSLSLQTPFNLQFFSFQSLLYINISTFSHLACRHELNRQFDLLVRRGRLFGFQFLHQSPSSQYRFCIKS